MAWLLTAAAVSLATAMAALACYMLWPVDFAGGGNYGMFALLFPLHVLSVTVLSAGLSVVAWSAGAVTAAAIFVAVAILTAVMALWPTVAVWRGARREHVRLSLRAYVANALGPNFGGSHPGRTVAYGTAPDGTKLELDVWRAVARDGDARHAAVVVVHGGGWVGGSRGQAERWNDWLNALGYDVFDVDYRLPPPARWRDEVADVEAALGWVGEHTDDYGIDPSRISVMGHSAGGSLAMLAAYASSGPARVRAVVNFYGPADLTALYDVSGSRRYIRECLHAYVGGSPGEYPDRYRAVSPVDHVDASAPPTLTVLGQSDRIVPTAQAHALDVALRDAGAAHETCLLPGNDHAFDMNWGGFGTQIARARVEAFLERYG